MGGLVKGLVSPHSVCDLHIRIRIGIKFISPVLSFPPILAPGEFTRIQIQEDGVCVLCHISPGPRLL